MHDTAALPQRTRIYRNHHIDSTRWDLVPGRDGDIVISTSYKAGTTWMQTIVANLLFWDGEIPGPVVSISPWIDMRVFPLEEMIPALAAQTHRRFVKTHLALDGLPYRPAAQYIVVGRDARDVFMSLYNHYAAYTPGAMAMFNHLPGRVGPELPDCPADVPWLWRQWITKGWFEWESDGWPMWSHLHHLRTWWEHRALPNVLFVHYNDLKTDLEGEMRRVAAYLGIRPAERAWPRLVEAATLASMKRNADKIMPDMAGAMFEGGAQRFLYKGTNRRWEGVLGDDDLALYPLAVEKTLAPDAAAWLERGRLGTPG